MHMVEKCTITVTIRDKSDHYHEEDWVKQIWPYLLPWFTKRHGVEKGRISLEDDAVVVEWRYENNTAENLRDLMQHQPPWSDLAQAGEAGTAETPLGGSVHEHAVARQGDAP